MKLKPAARRHLLQHLDRVIAIRAARAVLRSLGVDPIHAVYAAGEDFAAGLAAVLATHDPGPVLLVLDSPGGDVAGWQAELRARVVPPWVGEVLFPDGTRETALIGASVEIDLGPAPAGLR